MKGLLLSICLVTTGCVPWIRHETVSPAFVGRLTDAGIPVAGATVRLVGGSLGQRAPAPGLAAVTDATGNFSLPAERDWTFWQYVAGPADRPHFWTLQIAHGASWRVGWAPAGMAPYPVTRVIADCDLSRDDDTRHTSPDHDLRGHGICRVGPAARAGKTMHVSHD